MITQSPERMWDGLPASPPDRVENLTELITGRSAMQAEAAGFAAGRLAEAFRQVKLPD